MISLRANLFLAALGLSLLSLVVVYSATYRELGMDYLISRTGHVALGVVVFAVMSRMRYTAWRRLTPWIYLGALASLALVLVPGLGVEIGGARRWLELGPVSFQPSEFAKIAAVLALSCAAASGRFRRSGARLPFRALGIVGLLILLVLLEPDFSAVVVLLAGCAGVLWASECRTRDLILSGGTLVAALAGVMLVAPYRRERLVSFLDPWSVEEGSGYQVVQSMTAIKSGDLLGAGVGAGSESSTVPELPTDMPFTLIGEELGLVGMAVVIGAFCFLALAGLKISLAAPSVLGRCLAAGLTAMICTQAMCNIGITLGVLPPSGMTLPFVSYGGTSLIASFAAVGILYRISEDSERAREVKPGKPVGKPAGPDRRRRHRGARDPRALRG